MSRPLVWIHADESCLGNQFKGRANPGGAGGLVEHWRERAWVRRDYWTSDRDTTNNRMAITSAIVGLSFLRRPCAVRFVSDSQYLVRGMNEWIYGWKARGWKRKGGAVENVELWKRLAEVSARHEVTWEWVRGHDGHPRNEYANELATGAAERQDRSDGLVPSEFVAWLNEQREERGRYVDFYEFEGPE